MLHESRLSRVASLARSSRLMRTVCLSTDNAGIETDRPAAPSARTPCHVKPHVFRAQHQFKIPYGVVRTVTISVMNNLIRREATTDVLFHDVHMLPNATSTGKCNAGVSLWINARGILTWHLRFLPRIGGVMPRAFAALLGFHVSIVPDRSNT